MAMGINGMDLLYQNQHEFFKCQADPSDQKSLQ